MCRCVLDSVGVGGGGGGGGGEDENGCNYRLLSRDENMSVRFTGHDVHRVYSMMMMMMIAMMMMTVLLIIIIGGEGRKN